MIATGGSFIHAYRSPSLLRRAVPTRTINLVFSCLPTNTPCQPTVRIAIPRISCPQSRVSRGLVPPKNALHAVFAGHQEPPPHRLLSSACWIERRRPHLVPALLVTNGILIYVLGDCVESPWRGRKVGRQVEAVCERLHDNKAPVAGRGGKLVHQGVEELHLFLAVFAFDPSSSREKALEGVNLVMKEVVVLSPVIPKAPDPGKISCRPAFWVGS